ncbi:hypothetical protein FACS189472_17470 [Alphaproteobacteria bacterium]|nr:hypothetical protein FACS189472_17470 [Alphaproteobacteria bacterium]
MSQWIKIDYLSLHGEINECDLFFDANTLYADGDSFTDPLSLPNIAVRYQPGVMVIQTKKRNENGWYIDCPWSPTEKIYYITLKTELRTRYPTCVKKYRQPIVIPEVSSYLTNKEQLETEILLVLKKIFERIVEE